MMFNSRRLQIKGTKSGTQDLRQ